MKLSLMMAFGMFSVATASYAGDTLSISLPGFLKTTPAENRNNIKYVDFHSNTHEEWDVATPFADYEQELVPSFLDVYTTSGLWRQGWFIGLSGVASSFVGDPLGCDDLFGRVKPGLQLSLGKWFIPSVGFRIQYQGFDFKSGALESQSYHSLQSDLMLDLAALWDKSLSVPRFSLSPFVGCGIIKNEDTDTHPFSLHYGLVGSMRLSSCWAVNLELSSMNTFKDFDGAGSSHQFGDQFLNASLGLTFSLGDRQTQKRVVDAAPYMEQNRRLLLANECLRGAYRSMSAEIGMKNRMLKEYEKILMIKGWLARNYGSSDASDTSADSLAASPSSTIGYPYNNYSGLNSLRDRLGARFGNAVVSGEGWDETIITDASLGSANGPLSLYGSPLDGSLMDGFGLETGADSASDASQYMRLLRERKVCLGAPILFFFHHNSTRMTEPSQMENLREIAELVIRYDLKVKIVGAADSATGNESINQDLSIRRAEFIEDELMKLGVDSPQIRKVAAGGIDKYSPSEANRNSRVELYF